MAIPYCDLTQREWGELLINNSVVQRGGGLVGFRGVPFQRGYGLGSFFKSIFRAAAPLTKKIIKNVAKEGLSSAVQIGSDLIEGRNLKESVTEHSKAAGKRLLKRGVKGAKKRLQKGTGVGHRNKPIKRRKKRQIGSGKKRSSKPKFDFLDL